MAKPFDATTKTLVEIHPTAWLELAGLPTAPVEIINADLATVTTEADKVLRVLDPAGTYLLHQEFQAGPDAFFDLRVLRCNVLVTERHHLPVESVAVLLRPEADSPPVRGEVVMARAGGQTALSLDGLLAAVRAKDGSLRERLQQPAGTHQG